LRYCINTVHLRDVVIAREWKEHPMRFAILALGIGTLIVASRAWSAEPAPNAGPYRLLQIEKVGGEGGFDYVYADADGRKLYIPRSSRPAGRVDVYDLDTLKPAGSISNTNGVHGVAVDPKSHHGFASSKPVVMFDTQTLQPIKNIEVEGNPDGILFEPATETIYVLSHGAPNVTIIKASDGSIAGTIDLGGAPEQAASDGNGRVYIDVEDRDNVAVVDARAMKVLAHYDLAGKGGGPAGLALDAKNHVLFAFCRNPHTAVILNADDGKILATLPIGSGVDAGEFNPHTLEAFSSQRDGTLTVIKESNPTTFEVEQTVQTKPGARTSTLDLKTGRIYLITAEQAAPPANAGGEAPPPAGGAQARPRGGRGGRTVPGSFFILMVGK
jgi:DNA-binding beta-propeller fold protein YncE